MVERGRDFESLGWERKTISGGQLEGSFGGEGVAGLCGAGLKPRGGPLEEEGMTGCAWGPQRSTWVLLLYGYSECLLLPNQEFWVVHTRSERVHTQPQRYLGGIRVEIGRIATRQTNPYDRCYLRAVFPWNKFVGPEAHVRYYTMMMDRYARFAWIIIISLFALRNVGSAGRDSNQRGRGGKEGRKEGSRGTYRPVVTVPVDCL